MLVVVVVAEVLAGHLQVAADREVVADVRVVLLVPQVQVAVIPGVAPEVVAVSEEVPVVVQVQQVHRAVIHQVLVVVVQVQQVLLVMVSMATGMPRGRSIPITEVERLNHFLIKFPRNLPATSVGIILL